MIPGLNYTPPPTVRDFMLCDSIMKVIIGPLGSGKSMGAILDLFRRSCEQAPDAQGIRPTRMVLVRNSAQQLRETTLADCQEYLPIAHWKVSTSTLEIRINLPDGTKVHSDWIFLPLERPEDTRKLLSLNLTGGFIEECREIRYEVVAALMGRVGRYPMKARVEPTWQGIMCASNPWSEGSDWHEHMVLNRPDDWRLFRQPGGLDKDAENVANLPTDYYERLMQGHSQGWINVHVHAQFGDDPSGQTVFRGTFDGSYHVAHEPFRFNTQLPVLIGIDFGRTGAAIIGQEDLKGTLLCHKEIVSEDVGLEGFLELHLIPWLREHCWSSRVFVVGDPAGSQRSQLSEESAFEVLKKCGLDAIPAPTNNIRERVMAVERRLLESRGRSPAVSISATGCPKLVRAMLYGYRYRRNQQGELNPLPEKNEWSHPADAFQYLCLGVNANYVGKRISRIINRQMNLAQPARPKFSSRAWT